MISRYNRAMIIYQTFAVLFLLVTPIVAHALVNFLQLQVWDIKGPDLALPLFALELVLVSKKFLSYSFLPHYLLLMSSLAIIIIFGLVGKNKVFTYRRFFKRYWRVGFFLTVGAYLATLIFIFLTT